MQFLLIASDVTVFDCLAISLFLYFLVSFIDHRRRGGLSYPPGPPSWPIIGNLLDVPKDAPWSAYADMSKKYGMCILSVHRISPAETSVRRRCYVSSCCFSGRYRTVFGVSH